MGHTPDRLENQTMSIRTVRSLTALFFCSGFLLLGLWASAASASQDGGAIAVRPAGELGPEVMPEPIRVAIYDHTGLSYVGPKQLAAMLRPEAGFTTEYVTPEDVKNGILESGGFDVVILPGGSGSGQARRLGEQGRENICRFVAEGGGYVGICAGAYLGSSHYKWSLNLMNAKVLDTQHWARGTGQVILEMSEAGQRALDHRDDLAEVYYGQGPLLAPGDHPELPAYESLATYRTEIARNGAPKGVMIGADAIARAPFGLGRVFLVSPHPEKKHGLHHLIINGVGWVGGRGIEDMVDAVPESADGPVEARAGATPAAD